MTDAEIKIERLKLAAWPLVMAGIYAFFMLIGSEGEMMVDFFLFFDWLLVSKLGFSGSVLVVAGLGYLLVGFHLVGSDPHGERTAD